MKSQRNKKCLYNHKSIKGTKITVHAVTELAHKIFDQCIKLSTVLYVLAERSRQDPLETYFYKQHPPGA